MGWPLRMFQEEGYYFVTSRCFQGRLLLRPSAEVNEVVGGVLARALQQSADSVRLHAFTFASNHFHLLVWARGAALASFMQYLRANLSKKVGRLVDWSGGFWERRYSAEPVLDDEALVGRLRYVLAHGVKEGLVEKSAEWPGLTCLPQLLGPARRLFRWFNWTKRWSKRGSEEVGGAQGRYAQEWAEPVELEVAPLPCWEGLGEEERQRRVRGLVEGVEARDGVKGLETRRDPRRCPRDGVRATRPRTARDGSPSARGPRSSAVPPCPGPSWLGVPPGLSSRRGWRCRVSLHGS